MPRFVETRETAASEKYKHELINIDLLRCYHEIVKKEPVNTVIKTHKRLINQLQLHGHNKKHKSVDLLVHYKNTKDHAHGLYILINTLNNRGIFRKYA
jgi:hypothetical protein